MTAKYDAVRSYDSKAADYSKIENLEGCWGQLSQDFRKDLRVSDKHRLVVDVGCGVGDTLHWLAQRHDRDKRFVGIDPAANMRKQARLTVQPFPNVDVRDGQFERLPFEDASVDYLYSIFAFHWVRDVEAGIAELARVLGPNGESDILFTGRYSGREFTAKTTRIFQKYLGSKGVLGSASVRQMLTRDKTETAFAAAFGPGRVRVEESIQTVHDSLEGHWAWYVARSAPHFEAIGEKADECLAEVRAAIATLAEPEEIPYSVHMIHVGLGQYQNET